MVERRPLVEGLKKSETDRAREEDFVFQNRAAAAAATVTPLPVSEQQAPKPAAPRVPLSTRIRGDIAESLKRASLERQLQKLEPHSVQDILETALEPWLKAHGYL